MDKNHQPQLPNDPLSQPIQTSHQYRRHARFVMYILSFLFTLHYALPVYINSSFLASFSNDQVVGFVYIISSILAILVFFSMPRNLKKHGNYRVVVTLLIIEIISLLGMAFATDLTHSTRDALFIILPCFIASFVAVALINFNMDIFLENVSSTKNMGRARGFFLTSSNAAWVVAAVLTGVILTATVDYWKIFLAAAILILPVLFLLSSNLRDFKDPVYVDLPIWKTIKSIYSEKNILRVFVVDFLLQFFYAWMTVYTPIYLNQVIGFSWGQIGIMFSIMLLPFIITELPLGKLADKGWSEKEIMSIGFIVVALSTALMSFIEGNNFWLWTAILVITRIGASMIEIMCETYFFKKMDGGSAEYISFFRTIRPFAYIFSPIVAMILFVIPGFQFQYTFIVLAVIMFFGLRYSLALEDIK